MRNSYCTTTGDTCYDTLLKPTFIRNEKLRGPIAQRPHNQVVQFAIEPYSSHRNLQSQSRTGGVHTIDQFVVLLVIARGRCYERASDLQ